MLLLTRRQGEQIQIKSPTGSETLEVLSRHKVRIGKHIFTWNTGNVIKHPSGAYILYKSYRAGVLKLGFTAPREIEIMRTELLGQP